MADTSPKTSILCTVSVPSFDPATRQLSSTSHHLLSTPTSLLNALPGRYKIWLQRPPTVPYQSALSGELEVDSENLSRRKRRRLNQRSADQFSPAEWATRRDKDESRSKTDKETDALHARILPALEAALEAIKVERAGNEDWLGSNLDRIEWLDDKVHMNDLQLDLAAMTRTLHARETDDVRPARILQGKMIKLEKAELVDSLVVNREMHNIVVEVNESSKAEPCTYLLPPSSAFRVSDFDTWPRRLPHELNQLGCPWDIVIMDPPWPNASAARSASYDTFDPYSLGKLDFRAILGDHPCLVAVWVTNRVKYRRLVTNKLFPSWGVKDPVDWWWIKITSQGEPVWSLDSVHRRCYEGLILGRYNPHNMDLVPLPRDKVFLACPVGHSRKPVILDLLRPFLGQAARGPNVLELFARTSLAGPTRMSDGGDHSRARGMYVSVGNEAIKFNVGSSRGQREPENPSIQSNDDCQFT